MTGKTDASPQPERSLRQQAQALALLPVLVLDSHDAITYWSPGAQLLYGFTPEEALGQTSYQLLQTQFPEPLGHIKAHLHSRRPWHGELTHTCKDGSRVFVASQWVPTMDTQTRSPQIIEINTDISAYKHAEETHDRLAAIVECSEDAIISKNLEGTITSWNAAAERLFGYRAEEAIGQSIMLITPPECHAEAAILLERLRADEHIPPFETIRMTKSGRRLEVSVTMSPVRDAAGTIIGASKILRDISEPKRVERAARLEREAAHRRQIEQREQILSAMMEHIPMGIAIADAPNVTVRMVSRHGRGLLQKAKEQILGAPAEHHPGTFEFFHPDGTPAAPEEMPLFRATIQGELVKGEEWVVARRDGVHLPILCTAAPIRDQKDRILGGVMGWQDLTRRKQAEKALQKAQAELQAHADALEKTVAERTARLRESVGELEAFSYSISHDLRAPIRAIRSFAQIVLLRAADQFTPLAMDLVQRIAGAAQAADNMIQEILALSRVSRQHLQLAPVDLEKLLYQLLQDRPELQSAGAEFCIQSPLQHVLGHEPSLRQCLINLLGNAVKYVAPGTRPAIRIWTETRQSSDLSGSASLLNPPPSLTPPLGFLRLWIQDNGIGIPVEDQPHIFELFQRAHHHPHYQGTGLGLAIVKKAVERMGGRVGVESSPGQGSRFWLELPRAHCAPADSVPEPANG